MTNPGKRVAAPPLTDSITKIPFGYCYCGCGQKTNLAPQSITSKGQVKGMPMRFLPNHSCRVTKPIDVRLWEHVEKSEEPDGCWLWMGYCDKVGHGIIKGEKRERVHVVSWVLHFGDVPPGMRVYQNCRIPNCVRPDHLLLAKCPPVNLKFWDFVSKKKHRKGCWVWTGTIGSTGYGVIYTGGRKDGRQIGAHRVSYEMHFGPIPDDLWVLHTCDNPPCVRPDHLFLGTPDDNSKDAVSKGRHVHGTRHPLHKLVPRQVRRIRYLRENEELTWNELASRFRVSRSLVREICNRTTWKHVQ